MDDVTFVLSLTRAAKKSGGDRYEFGTKGDPEWMVVYFPQYISRPNGVLKESLYMKINYEEQVFPKEKDGS